MGIISGRGSQDPKRLSLSVLTLSESPAVDSKPSGRHLYGGVGRQLFIVLAGWWDQVPPVSTD